MVSFIDSLILPENFWYVIYVLCPGYITGLTISKWKWGKTKVWFELESFDKLIISMFFGAMYLFLIKFLNRMVFWLFEIQLMLSIVVLFILATSFALTFLIVVFAIYARMTVSANQKLENSVEKAVEKKWKKK